MAEGPNTWAAARVSDKSKFVSKILAFALCPSRFVHIVWTSIKAAAPSQVANIDDLCTYFQDSWLNGSFPIQSWIHCGNERPRTNNHVQGWDSKINAVAGKTHPNVFELVELFQSEQGTTEATLQQLAEEEEQEKESGSTKTKTSVLSGSRVSLTMEPLLLSTMYIDRLNKWMGFL